MKIGILYICTGRYSVFWEDFYKSCEANFLSDHPKHYFVFTDSADLKFNDADNVHVHYQKKLGWPFDTLDRFRIFSRIEDELRGYDYLFFFNANALIVEKIGTEIIDPDLPLIGAKHPVYYDKDNIKFSYERNPRSKAYMKNGEGYNYYVGGFNGGESGAYLAMVSELNERIEADKSNDIIATWHDESHLNKYYFENHDKIKILPPAYMYPEEMSIPFEKNIIVRSKKRLGGHNYLRGISDKKRSKISLNIDKFYRSLFK